MKKIIKPSHISGKIKAPPSKSFTQRAIAAALLSNGTTIINNPSFCLDSLTALKIAENLGAIITKEKNKIILKGGLSPVKNLLNCAESGLSLRMFTPIASLLPYPITLTGKKTLLHRPIGVFEQPLKKLSVTIKTNNGLLPITVKGHLQGGKATLDGSLSSQFLTGFLMALPLTKNDSELIVENLKSKPYIDITLQVLTEFGIEIENRNYKYFRIKGGQQYKSCNFTVEGDWSNAAFLLVAAALSGNIEITGLNNKSCQGDIKIIQALKEAGAMVILKHNSVIVQNPADGELKPFVFDATDCPDLFPPLVSLSAHCNGTSIIKGVKRLIFKESNRANTLQQEFAKLGIEINIENNKMLIKGGIVKGAKVFSHNDHRIAMALATTGVGAKGNVIIENAECIRKSYPEFFSYFERLGMIIQ